LFGWIGAETGGCPRTQETSKVRYNFCTTSLRALPEEHARLDDGPTLAAREVLCQRSGGETSFLHLGQTTVGCPMGLLFLAPVRCFFMTQQ